ncbi:hypothetical protein EI77_01844 [Prosthecobacter fusiformis]|uniref:Uncharacterized protein n=1 Tax=Prosthecobacter fusiformis TaxID=48464 RepID=A0A4R7S4W0_9BACT|nr:hypothetical protein [Prosthecobacter fusiformis]TDU73374.1 hypothetical protein EI77_01844 [Prosthecobacter fusiformis]
MALKTCFLPNFPRLLQGRAKRPDASRLASGLQDLRQLALPDLSSLLAAFLPDAFFAKAPGAKARRVRLLPPVTVFCKKDARQQKFVAQDGDANYETL